MKNESENNNKGVTDQTEPQILSRSWVAYALANWAPWKRLRWYFQMRREENIDFRIKHDSEENEQGRLPDAESVQVPAIWVAELYTPSEIEGLLQGIQKLDWEQGMSRNESLFKWIDDVRKGRSGGWTSLGLVSPEHGAFVFHERTAQLPQGVQAALPTLISLTPGITALVIGFLMNDQSSGALNDPLRSYYNTRRESSQLFRWWHTLSYVFLNKKLRFGWSIESPDIQRRKAVGSCIKELETGCISWIRKNLPGVFTSGLRSGMTPTAVLMVTEVTPPRK